MNATPDTQDASERLVRDFLGAWTGRDIDALCGYFAADAVYHNVPVAPIIPDDGAATTLASYEELR